MQSILAGAKALGYPALALTDTNNLYGAIPFYKQARELGIKPILGCELRCEQGRVVLLVRNRTGYANLCKVITRRHIQEHFSLAPVLSRFHEGLHILCDDPEVAARLVRCVDSCCLWLLLTAPGPSAAQRMQISRRAHELKLGVVATPDVYFLEQEDYALHRVLSAIRQNTLFSKLRPEDLAHPQSFLPSPQEIQKRFQDCPEGLLNNARIVEDCDLDVVMGRPIFPKFPLPRGETAPSFLSQLCFDGLKARYRPVTRKVSTRLRRELRIIEKLGFTEYFLFVWDILSFARQNRIPTVGRGSGASSIVSYALGITSVDPIEYHIPFERFLHLKRADCPDLDIDLCWIKRDEVINSIYEKYGASRVAMVATHSTFRLRGAFREVAKAFGVSNGIVNDMGRRLPYDAGYGLREALQNAPPGVRDRVDDHVLRAVWEFGDRIRGFPKHLGIHCGGLVIGDKTLDHYVPLEIAAKGIVITQFEKDAIEDVGLVKMDFLGNHGLTIRDEASALIERETGQALRVEEIPKRDRCTARLLRRAQTLGCCQLESPAMRHLLRMLRASTVEQVMQALGLIRPGPASLGMKEKFVRRARKLEPAVLPHPSLAEALGDSYGIMLYEDDAMLVAQALAGVDLGEGDLLRKVIKKERSRDKLIEVSEAFVQKAASNGVPAQTAREMWTQMAKFNSYSFCKAHAASYAILAYQLAFLKAHYPLEFMVAVLNHQWGMYPKRVHLEEARRLGIHILGPCVNRSDRDFTVENSSIRVGLEQIRGLTGSSITSLIERRSRRPFRSLGDLVARVPISRKEAADLVLCGAFDFTGRARPQLLWELEASFEVLRKASAHPTLFPLERAGAAPELRDYSPTQKLKHELKILELFVSQHPMEMLRPYLDEWGFIKSRGIGQRIDRTVRVAGILAATREMDTSHDRGAMEFLTLEDEDGIFEVTLFPRIHRRYRHLIDDMGPYLVTGKVENQYGSLSVTASELRAFPRESGNAARPSVA